MPGAIIYGCAGETLSAEETAFFRDADPVGFILFARNCVSKKQVSALTLALRTCLGRDDTPILIDQEGGRVARLKPPEWPAFPAMSVFGERAAIDEGAATEACRINASLIGLELATLGIDVDCAPVLDLPQPGAHDVIGDRALSRNPVLAAKLGRAVCDGLQAAGVIPIVKHIPGHGRAMSDSHHELPVVDAPLDELERTDFEAFRLLADAPWAMVAHVLFTAVDASHPASTSCAVVERLLRGSIGFEGVLIADDIGMNALPGTLPERAQATLASGCDLTMHCSGVLDEMLEIAHHVAPLSAGAAARLKAGRSGLGRPSEIDPAASRARYAELMERVAS